MRIMDVQEFISTQYKDNQKRRVSQHTKFLDRNVHFFTYFNINKAASTTSINNHTVDSYIGKDSPVRYNVINNFPMYGFPLFSDENSYDDENAGLSTEYSGDLVMLPGLIEPSEGDCFILPMYDPNRFFIVTEVRQVALKGKSHYSLQFTNGIPDYLDQLKSQVIDEFNAIFDNIGTEDRVVISNKEYKLKEQYERIYKFIHDHYLHKFFDRRKTMFLVNYALTGIFGEQLTASQTYCDIFCTKFMNDNRIIVMDSLLKSSLMLDYNSAFSNADYFKYRDSLYNAVAERSTKYMKKANYILTKKLYSPFALSGFQDSKEIYLTDSYNDSRINVVNKDNPLTSLEFDFSDILDRIEKNKIYISDDERDKLISIIVRYFSGETTINPGYFTDIELDDVDEVYQYMLLPIILYIIRDNIYGLTRLNTII